VLFGTPLPDDLFFFDLPTWTFLASALAGIVVSVVLVIRRFARITT